MCMHWATMLNQRLNEWIMHPLHKICLIKVKDSLVLCIPTLSFGNVYGHDQGMERLNIEIISSVWKRVAFTFCVKYNLKIVLNPWV